MGVLIGLVIMVALLMIGIPIGPIMMSLGMAGGWLSFGQPFLDPIGSVIWGVHTRRTNRRTGPAALSPSIAGALSFQKVPAASSWRPELSPMRTA